MLCHSILSGYHFRELYFFNGEILQKPFLPALFPPPHTFLVPVVRSSRISLRRYVFCVIYFSAINFCVQRHLTSQVDNIYPVTDTGKQQFHKIFGLLGWSIYTEKVVTLQNIMQISFSKTLYQRSHPQQPLLVYIFIPC